MGKLKFFFLATVAVVIILVVTFLLTWGYFKQSSIIPNKGMTYLFKPGTSVAQLIRDLESEGQLKSPVYFKLLLRLRHAATKLQAGEYFFPAGSTPDQVINQMVTGKVVRHSFTIIDGWTIYQVLAALRADPDIKQTLTDHSLQQVAKQLKIPHNSPEGLLYPDTYYFTLGTTDTDILSRAYQKMADYLAQEWAKKAAHLPYVSQYQALIVASMIEKETAAPKEMPIISAVILKRLKIWMPLQIDSTVIYGLQPNFSGHLTSNELKKKTPYNTYTNYGLPPTPIAMPDVLAIHAALHPTSTKYLYFVAKGDGSHQFSSTLVEQKKAIATYLKKDSKVKEPADKGTR